ncbi:MAG: hypothetical protein LLG15_01885 [Betaproteobacteria bacterium]|nr:hypothetical protein [Betaproteobacteria bacterium]
MKFHDLSIGQRFELDGAAYVKTSPVLACREDGGTKFMARSALVKPLDGAEQKPKAVKERLVRANTVLAAFEVYHARCREVLERSEVSVDKRADNTDALERGRQDFLDALSAD